MPHLAAKPEEGSLELTEDIIRARAYRFYEDRGCEDGHDLEDWVRAEAEVTGFTLHLFRLEPKVLILSLF